MNIIKSTYTFTDRGWENTRQYWQHKASGEVFAVWWCGHCIEASGPLYHADITFDNLVNWDFYNDPDLAYDISRWPEDYRLWEGAT